MSCSFNRYRNKEFISEFNDGFNGYAGRYWEHRFNCKEFPQRVERTGSVSPPPPGLGPRCRMQCCWSVPAHLSWFSPLATPSINNLDIISSANRLKMNEKATSELTQSANVQDLILSNKLLLKSRYRRLNGLHSEDIAILNTLDRLPRFRFGGNRTNKVRDFDRTATEQRLRELAERIRRSPVPPPRTKRLTPPSKPKTEELPPKNENTRTPPARSASFSQVEYLADSKKYARKQIDQTHLKENAIYATLPRTKPYKNQNGNLLSNNMDTTNAEKITTPIISVDTTKDEDIPNEEDKKFKFRRRKGVYLSQWSAFVEPPIEITNAQPEIEPKIPEVTPEWSRHKLSDYPYERTNSTESHSRETSVNRLDYFSEDESERRSDQVLLQPLDTEECQKQPKRYNKRPLRGPYGQMLEAEMKKPEGGKKNSYDLNFLSEIHVPAGRSSSMKLDKELKPKHSKRDSSSRSYDDTQFKSSKTFFPKRKISVGNVESENVNVESVNHHRTISSPSKLGNCVNPEISQVLLEQLLQGSSEKLAILDNKAKLLNDTRTHVVVELYDNERNYVESLQILMTKYLEPLKSQEFAGLLNSQVVDEVFNQIPCLLLHHQNFLEELKKRLDQWDIKQKIGDIYFELFSKTSLIEAYTCYVNNWKRAKDIIKNTQQTKPTFARFLENNAREHKGKLALDSLLIKPIQRFPRYELLLQRLIKHTDINHIDHTLLLLAQKELHEQTLKLNCTERESLELEQLKEIEGLIEGLMDLATLDRQFLRHDLVSMSAGTGTRKERGLLLFSDLLLVTSIKRKSGTIRKPPAVDKVTSALEANKYKLLMKISLRDLEILKPKDENVRQTVLELDKLNEDLKTLTQINDLSANLHCNHTNLNEILKEMITTINKQIMEQQSNDSQLSYLDLSLNTSNGVEYLSILFSTPEKRASWEESFTESKNKLLISGVKRPLPELVATVPIRKTRAGLQFTCAAPTLGENGRDVWVCNSDGYVGQVCILSFQPEPTVTSCNGVCNARILCIASIPANSNSLSLTNTCYLENEGPKSGKMQFDSSSSSEDDEKSDEENIEPNHAIQDSTDTSSIDLEEPDGQQPTMWLGTEDGCIYVYSASDNIRIKRNKIKIQHSSSIFAIIYLDNRVFISLANGDVIVYDRDSSGCWNITTPLTIPIGSSANPVIKMIEHEGKIWCNCGNSVKILNTQTLVTENIFNLNGDYNKSINSLVITGNNVWLSLQNTAIVKCYNTTTLEFICEVNVAPAVTKMLTSCDDIIRQHKSACLRITALLASKDILWIGTSAGVLLTMQLTSAINQNSNVPPVVTGVSHGHTGHVRFLTHIEIPYNHDLPQHQKMFERISDHRGNTRSLVISGGDGYEDFRSSNISEVAGREDSTNHLLLWSV